MRTLGFVCFLLILFFAVGIWKLSENVRGDGTYASLGTSDAGDGSADAITWDQGNGFIIDEFGKYIILTQARSGPTSHWAWSNDDGSSWTQGSQAYTFLTRGSIAYDSNNDKLHVIWQATNSSDGIIYRRYGITRDGLNNITAITREDSSNINLQLDLSGSCSFDLPSGIWVDDGSENGLLVATWTKNCSGDPMIIGSMRALSLSEADGSAENWVAIDGTGDNFSTNSPQVEADKIYDGASGTVGSSIRVRGGSGARADDLYVFVQPKTSTSSDEILAYRAIWSSGNSDWSGGWQSPVDVGPAGSEDGYTLKQQLISKIVLDEVNDRLYVAWARWKTGGDGDTVSFAYLDSSDNASSTFDVYSAGGTHSYAPTMGISFDSTLGNLIFAYVESTTNGDNGSIDYVTFDGSTVSSEVRFYTSSGGSSGTDGSADIPVMYPSRVDDRVLFLFRVNGALPPTSGDPHSIYFGYVSLAVPTNTPTPTPTNTPTPTPTNTPTPIPTSTPTPSSDGSGSGSEVQGSTTQPPVCTNLKPGSAPELYAAVPQSESSIMLYFTDVGGQTDHYTLTYGDVSGDYSWGVDDIGEQGIRTYLVGGLSSGTEYFFKVRAGNGCAPGAWSNEISAATPSNRLFSQNLEIGNTELVPDKSTQSQEKAEDNEDRNTEYTLSIYVKDTEGKAVEGANVTVYSDPKNAVTNAEGLATVNGLEEGQHRVVIAYDGYAGEESIYISGEKESYDLNVTVEKKNSGGMLLLGVVSGVVVMLLVFGGYWALYRRK